MSKFKVGDDVIGQNFYIVVKNNGLDGRILEIPRKDEWFRMPDGRIEHLDYYVEWSDGGRSGCKEHNLRKKRPPEQPSAFSYDEIISMCNEDIRPTETQVREGLKGILQPFAGLEKVGEK